MPPCPACQHPAATRDGHTPMGRQRYTYGACGGDFTAHSGAAFAGYRWPAAVILLAVRWSLSHPLSATSVMELLTEQGIDVSKRTVLRWVQPSLLTDDSEQVKLFIASITYGVHYSEDFRLHSPIRFVEKLVNTGEAGSAKPILRDYVLLT